MVGSESEDSVQSSVVRDLSKSVLIVSLVEELSVAYTKITTKATTNDNGIDNDDNEARRATFNAGHVDAKDLRRRHP